MGGQFSPTKIGIIILTVVIVLIPLIVWFAMSQSTKPAQNLPVETPSESVISKAPIPTLPEKSAESLDKQFIGTSYSVNIPTNWKVYNYQVAGGGVISILTPNKAEEAEQFPRLSVEETPKTAETASIEKRIADIAPLGFAQEDITFQNIPAKKLSGIMPYKLAGKEVVKSYIFLERNDKIFVLDYSYFVNDKITSEKLLQEILSTYSFQ